MPCFFPPQTQLFLNFHFTSSTAFYSNIFVYLKIFFSSPYHTPLQQKYVHKLKLIIGSIKTLIFSSIGLVHVSIDTIARVSHGSALVSFLFCFYT